jgi:hydrocephalus-inducing protein
MPVWLYLLHEYCCCKLDRAHFGYRVFLYCVKKSRDRVEERHLLQVVLEFRPDFAKNFVETVYVDMDGIANRVPVVVSGLGLGPNAIFSYDVLDVGNVYIHTAHHYQVQLENRGEVPVPFTVMPGSGPLTHAFTLEPASGVVPVDESLQLGVKLLADRLGKFDEKMFLQVEGTNKPLQVQFKGRVVGPTCELDQEQLNYGLVAYGFRCESTFNICPILN